MKDEITRSSSVRQSDTAARVYCALRSRARRKETFQSGKLRKELGYEAGSPEKNEFHTIIRDCRQAGLIDIVGSGRKRNRSMQVNPKRVDDLSRRFKRAKERARRNADGNQAAKPKPGDREEELAARLQALEASMDVLMDDVRGLVPKVDKLVELWS